jgi:hypothetical protein
MIIEEKKEKKGKKEENKSKSQQNQMIFSGSQRDILNLEASYTELLSDYDEMLKSNDVLSTAFQAALIPIMRAESEIIPGNNTDMAKIAADYTREAIEKISPSISGENIQEKGGFDEFRRNALYYAVGFGNKCFEIIQKRALFVERFGHTTNIIKKLIPLEISKVEEYVIKNTMFQGIIYRKNIDDVSGQELPDDWKSEETGNDLDVPISASKLFVYTHNMLDGDIRGNSELRPVRNTHLFLKNSWIATVRALTRGAGFPEVKGKNNTHTLSQLTTIARNIGNNADSYAVTDDNVEIILHELKNMNNSVEILRLLRDNLFFNFFAHWMTSGIGSNGSRASTKEHKTAFQLKTEEIKFEFEVFLQQVVDYIIKISFFTLKKEQMPKIKLASINQIDMLEAAKTFIMLLKGGGLTKTKEDEIFIRALMGYPGIAEADIKTELPKQADSFTLSRDLTDHEKKYFELQSAIDHYESTQKDAEKELQEFIEKMLDDFSAQLIKNKDKDIKINRKMQREINKKLNEIYQNGFQRGKNDFEKELNKMLKEKGKVELKSRRFKNNVFSKIKKSLRIWVRRLLNNAKSVIEATLSKITPEAIRLKGGIKEFIKKSFAESFRMNRRTIINDIAGSYTDGRGEAIKEQSDKIGTLIYTAILDKNTCAICAPLYSKVFTIEEIKEAGLNLSHPVNPDCFGKDRDRCQWIIGEIK